MQVIILAAGPGTRLLPQTEMFPKCLVPVNNYPILYYQLRASQQNALTNVVLVVGYKAELVKQYVLTHFPTLQYTFIYNPVFSSTNTLYSLALAAETVRDDSVLLLNGDVIFDPRILGLIVKKNPKKSYTAVQIKRCGKEEIKFTLTLDGSVNALNKKISPQKALGESIGINKFSNSFWKNLSKSLSSLKNNSSYEYFEFAVEQCISRGEKLFPYDIGVLKAIEIDFLEDLAKATSWAKFIK